jgi:superfamily I DNA/RNA helicase
LLRIAKQVISGEYRKTIATLKRYTKPSNPKVTLITAHRSKGMEYNQVVLANDFPSAMGESGEFVGLNGMERNLLYVAATRAQVCLELNETAEDIMENYYRGVDNPLDEVVPLIEEAFSRETSSDMAVFTNEQMEEIPF